MPSEKRQSSENSLGQRREKERHFSKKRKVANDDRTNHRSKGREKRQAKKERIKYHKEDKKDQRSKSEPHIYKKRKKLESVVIIANSRYAYWLYQLESLKVTVLADDDLRFNNLCEYINEKKKNLPVCQNTLWLLVTGIFCIASTKINACCEYINCPEKLYSLKLQDDLKSFNCAKLAIDEREEMINKTLREIQNTIGYNSYVIMLPPLPVSICSESRDSHTEYHNLLPSVPHLYTAVNCSLLHSIYLIFVDQITRFSIKVTKDARLPYVPISNYLNARKKSLKLVEDINLHKKDYAFEEWTKCIIEFISLSLETDISPKLLSGKSSTLLKSAYITENQKEVKSSSRGSNILITEKITTKRYNIKCSETSLMSFDLTENNSFDSDKYKHKNNILDQSIKNNYENHSKYYNSARSSSEILPININEPKNYNYCVPLNVDCKIPTNTNIAKLSNQYCNTPINLYRPSPSYVQNESSPINNIFNETVASHYLTNYSLTHANDNLAACVNSSELVKIISNANLIKPCTPQLQQMDTDIPLVIVQETTGQLRHPEQQMISGQLSHSEYQVNYSANKTNLHSLKENNTSFCVNGLFLQEDNALNLLHKLPYDTTSYLNSKSKVNNEHWLENTIVKQNKYENKECHNNFDSKKINALELDGKLNACFQENHPVCLLDNLINASKSFNGSNKQVENAITLLTDVLCIKESNDTITKYDHAYVIGQTKLVEPFKESNLSITVIDYDLSDIEVNDTQNVLSKLGKLLPNSICCLIFDYSVIANSIPVSKGCSTFSCQIPIPMLVLKYSDGKRDDTETLIFKRLKSIMSFVKELSHSIPSIIFPLLPTKFFCDSNKSVKEHQLGHAVSHYSFVVSGIKSVWESDFKSLFSAWNNLLQINYEFHGTELFISKYILRDTNSFSIIETKESLLTYWIEPDIWEAFSESILLYLLSADNSETNLSTSKEGWQKDNYMKVSNISRVPIGFFRDLVCGLDSSAKIQMNDDCLVVMFCKRNLASIVIENLNNFKIADSTFLASNCRQLEIIGKKQSSRFCDRFIVALIICQTYFKWRMNIMQNIRNEINKVPDILNIKQNRCLIKKCEKFDKCLDYHDNSDQRRNPFTHDYSDKMCPKMTLKGFCSDDDFCKSCHNIYEQLFHPARYQEVPCPYSLLHMKCSRGLLCNLKHLDTPDTFFSPLWEDLSIFGPFNTFLFFAGAIRAAGKIASRDGILEGFKIILISTNQQLLEIMEFAVQDLVQRFNFKLLNMESSNNNPELYQVILTTPKTCADSVISWKFSSESRLAIIVDNASKLLDEVANGFRLQHFFNKLNYCSTKDASFACINRVFISRNYDTKTTSVLSTFLNMKLKEVINKENRKSPLENKFENEISTQTAVVEIREDTILHQHTYNNNIDEVKKILNDSIEEIVLDDDCNSTKSQLEQKTVVINDKWANSTVHSEVCFKEFESITKTISTSSLEITTNEYQRGHELFTQGKNNFTTLTCSEFNPSNAELRVFNNGNLEDLKIKLGSKLYENYLKKEHILLKKLNDEYEVYKEFPEFHKKYQSYSESFNNIFDNKLLNVLGNGNESKDREWKKFWSTVLKIEQEKEGDMRRIALIKEYEDKIEARECIGISMEFSIEATLSLLEKLSNNIGLLGPAVLGLIHECKSLGSTTAGALRIFTLPENIDILNEVLEKFSALKDSESYMEEVYSKGIEWTQRLLEIAPSRYSSSFFNTINTIAIAKATSGKDDMFVIDMIKTALLYEGIPNPSDQDINDLFLYIRTLQGNS